MMTGKPNGKPHNVFHVSHWQAVTALLILYDLVAVTVSYFFALFLRFDLRFSLIPDAYLATFLRFAPGYAAACVVVFMLQRLYRSIWRFASYVELLHLILANLITFVIQVAGTLLFFQRMPISYYLFGSLSQFVLTVAIRFSYRFILLLRNRSRLRNSERKHVMVIGAGAAGQMIVRDIMKSEQSTSVACCIIDDNPNKQGRYVDGVPVVGGRDDILAACRKYEIDRICLAIPSASAENRRDILNICKESGCELKTLPGLYQLANGEVSVRTMKDVEIEDLLGREPVSMKMEGVDSFLRGKTVLVTGGGGSIGSELCRQIARYHPARLIVFEIYENSAYEIQQELKHDCPDLDLVTLIGSVRDSRRLAQIFAAYRPDVVYHAAAHKHVPLMEDSPCESIKNNVIGTYKTAYEAVRHGCGRFVLISTDKAVNPVNIMGASKRLCEMIVQYFDRMVKAGRADELRPLHTHGGADGEAAPVASDAKTEFVAVRFGNVLGSNGSVIPLFKKQIAAGGPVTVTHPDIIRYFMTIPEAVSLVLLAGTYARDGEIFVLDMGDPVKIDTLARNLIKLSGLTPDVDVKIVYSGLRPGEKLYEEKLMAEEGLRTTESHRIFIGRPLDFDEAAFPQKLFRLMEAAYDNDEAIREQVAELVGTYHPASEQATAQPEPKTEPEPEKKSAALCAQSA